MKAPLRTTPPEGLVLDEAGPGPLLFPKRPGKITLASEKGLVFFTLAMPALAAWFAGGLRTPGRAPALLPFLALAALAFGVSTAHLGRPLRALRAVLGVATSWLSREVVAATAFVLLALPFVALPHASPGPGLPALAAALLPLRGWELAFAAALASEAIDRASFYAGLEPSTPASRMEAEAQAALAAS